MDATRSLSNFLPENQYTPTIDQQNNSMMPVKNPITAGQLGPVQNKEQPSTLQSIQQQILENRVPAFAVLAGSIGAFLLGRTIRRRKPAKVNDPIVDLIWQAGWGISSFIVGGAMLKFLSKDSIETEKLRYQMYNLPQGKIQSNDKSSDLDLSRIF